MYGVLLVVIINFRPKGLFGHEELNLKNLPKLFVLIGMTVGLTIGTSVYNYYKFDMNQILALLLAALAAVAVTAAISYLGRILAKLLAPVTSRIGPWWNKIFSRFVHSLDGILKPKHKEVAAVVREVRAADKPIIRVGGLTKKFGGVTAVDQLDFEVYPGQLVGLIGPNGSGKTTVFNLISGVYPIDSGSIEFEDNIISGKSPTSIVLGGISRTFQNIRLFGTMTVWDNVKTALHTSSHYSLTEAFVQWPWTVWDTEKRMEDEALELLKVVGLEDLKDRVASTLPYGLQRKLEIARALALQPRLLLLDEPAAGMNPQESLDLVNLIKFVHKKFNLTIILIEHHMDVVMNLCEWITVLNYGGKIAEGTPEQIQCNPLVMEAYLGDKVDYATLS
jgi:ABC-type branched-subunit amino acid transport system ATPase component